MSAPSRGLLRALFIRNPKTELPCHAPNIHARVGSEDSSRRSDWLNLNRAWESALCGAGSERRPKHDRCHRCHAKIFHERNSRERDMQHRPQASAFNVESFE